MPVLSPIQVLELAEVSGALVGFVSGLDLGPFLFALAGQSMFRLNWFEIIQPTR